jgi:hypothetical protein
MDMNHEERVPPSAPYGFRIFDLEKKTSRMIKLPGTYEAWLNNEEFLLTSSEPEFVDQKLLRYRLGEEFPYIFSAERGWWGQCDVLKDGKSFLISLSQEKKDNPTELGESDLSSRIVKFNTKTGAHVDVSPIGGWSEYQMPQFSPSGKHISYVQLEDPDAETGAVKGKVHVDNKEISEFQGFPFQYKWVDDKTLVFIEEHKMSVIDAENGKLLFQVPINQEVEMQIRPQKL